MSKQRRPVLALFQPDIAANAGAMLRTCACLDAEAALIEPAGFHVSDSRFRRSVMDYVGRVRFVRYESFASFDAWRKSEGRTLALLTTRGETSLWRHAFRGDDVLMVGRESAGVPDDVAGAADVRLRIPIEPGARSLNVSVAAAIALAELLRQGLGTPPGA